MCVSYSALLARVFLVEIVIPVCGGLLFSTKIESKSDERRSVERLICIELLMMGCTL